MSDTILTYMIPCYNSAAYMDHCIETLLATGEGYDDIEILIVDDGSTKDDTPAKADEWEARFPHIITAIHQENGGHGAGVNAGIARAKGLYYKVVDSDDWFDVDNGKKLLSELRKQAASGSPVDLMICNYVYDHADEGETVTIDYKGVLPMDRVFSWDEVGAFAPSQNLLMHSVFYRTQVLHDCGIELPKHTFYVDNIFVYVPLPYVKTLYYLDIDLYHYYIGRDDQSVNEKVMISRIEQQLRVTRIMIDSVKIPEDVSSKRLENYMVSYLTMMMTICSIFLLLSDREDRLELRDEIWQYLYDRDETLYKRIHRSFMGLGSTLPGRIGRKASIAGYHLAQKVYKFN